MNSTYSISIVIPAKNESDTIGALITTIKSMLNEAEIIVVNDGSSDDTKTIAIDSGATVIDHPYSKGNGASIKTGAKHASGDILVFMDADGQHAPSDIPKLLEEINNGYDMVVGARGRESQASYGRNIANTIYNKFASYMVGHPVKDLTSGFRAVLANKFREFLYLLPNGFSYPSTSTMAFFRAGYSVKYVPIIVHKREGKSHISPLTDGFRFLLIIFKVGTLYSPLKIFFPLSLLFFLLGFGYYSYTFITIGRFTNMSALLLSTSIIIFLIGLVSEQISSLLYSKSS